MFGFAISVGITQPHERAAGRADFAASKGNIHLQKGQEPTRISVT